MNQATIDALNQWASQIENAVVKAAPAVWTTAVHVKQADAIGALVTGLAYALVTACIAVPLYALAVRSFKRGLDADAAVPRDGRCYGSVPGWMQYMVAAGSAVVAIGLTITGWFQFSAVAFDQWVWIGATNPGLAVSHDIITKILSQ